MLKSFNELKEVNIGEFTEERDGAEYLNWAMCKNLLHENGAEKVNFEAMPQNNGSSLIMAEKVFTDKNQNTNQVYETRIKVTIDELVFEIQGPVTNGANPVKDNSMTQQRLWNCQTRLFVKGVAIHTGLGFNLWLKNEKLEEKLSIEDLSKHKIMKIAQRVTETLSSKMKQFNLSKQELAEKVGISYEEFTGYLGYYATLSKFEEKIEAIADDKK